MGAVVMSPSLFCFAIHFIILDFVGVLFARAASSTQFQQLPPLFEFFFDFFFLAL